MFSDLTAETQAYHIFIASRSLGSVFNKKSMYRRRSGALCGK